MIRKKRETRGMGAAAGPSVLSTETPAGVAALMPQGGWKAVAYLLSLFPAVGLVMGLLFAPSQDPSARRFGRICLVLAVVGLIIGGIMSAMNLSGPDSGEKFVESFY
jgi:hypothetical protein